MKLICNNIWGARVYEPFVEFIKKHAVDTDIFCFQEVFHHGNPSAPGQEGSKMEIFSELGELLSDFDGHHAPPGNTGNSLAIFIRKNLNVENVGYFFVLGPTKDDSRVGGIPMQYASFTNGDKRFTICNLHGWWQGGSKKRDTPERLEQSRRVREFLDDIDGAKILCGDFNLAPDTQSISILEKDMGNMIKEYGITSTRSHFYPEEKEIRFADYILVSPDVNVKDSKVLEDPISDHLPLFLDFS